MEVGRRDIRFSSEEEEEKHQPSSSSDTGVLPGLPPPDAGVGERRLRPAEKEHMFDKVVTPSDVGKLNRLVIPKQHAERYFPLDSSSSDKGLHLNFEDRTGKPWRFRYSYWNSSQSYVMTKGWSRFVKEKRLDAGDTVSFGRGVGDADRDRLFIDWKRRPETAMINPSNLPRIPLPSSHHHHHQNSLLSFTGRSQPAPTWGNTSFPMEPSVNLYNHGHHHHHHHHHQPYNYHNAATTSGMDSRLLYFQQSMGLPSRMPPVTAVEDLMVLDSLPPASRGTAKRVRLFGVNLDCGEPDIDVSTPHSLQLRLGSSSRAEEEQSSWDDRDRS